jgi:hypothetical protein
MSSAGAPSARTEFASVVLGNDFVVWGGMTKGESRDCWDTARCTLAIDGAIYDTTTDRWRPMSPNGAPSGRYAMAFAASGDTLAVFGGKRGRDVLVDGAIYDHATDKWEPLAKFPLKGGPPERGTDAFEVGFPKMYATKAHLVVQGHTRAWVYERATKTWREATPPPTPIQLLIKTTDPTLWFAWPSEVALVDPALAVWRRAPLPEAGRPANGGDIAVWTGERLIMWGARYNAPDPTGGNGCGGPSNGRPCDPVQRTKEVFDRSGAMISPVVP